jgi:hypothetical protein
MPASVTTLEASLGAGRSVLPAPGSPGRVFVRDGAAWSELTPLEDQSFRVRLGGPFGQAWMAALGSGLAERRISIDQVHAKRARDGSWIAELHVLPLEGAVDPHRVSYIGLAHQTPQLPGGCKVALDTYELLTTADHGGTLKLSFEAPDSLGLLGGLLCSVAGLALYPLEMHIETRGGRAQDCLWLVGQDCSVPTEAAKAALEQLLEQSVTR